MPEDMGYEMIPVDANTIDMATVGGKLVHGDDRVSKTTVPASNVDLDFDVMLNGVKSGESKPMKLHEANDGKKPKKNGKSKY